uniref:Histone H2A n=1 Tax=Angiostrongylus cantonensis TaxID=6313 RepID=A0A0K0DGA1_ANGCA
MSGGKSTSRSARAGLQLLVGRLHRMLGKGNYSGCVGVGAPVYLPYPSTSLHATSLIPGRLWFMILVYS